MQKNAVGQLSSHYSLMATFIRSKIKRSIGKIAFVSQKTDAMIFPVDFEARYFLGDGYVFIPLHPFLLWLTFIVMNPSCISSYNLSHRGLEADPEHSTFSQFGTKTFSETIVDLWRRRIFKMVVFDTPAILASCFFFKPVSYNTKFWHFGQFGQLVVQNVFNWVYSLF